MWKVFYGFLTIDKMITIQNNLYSKLIANSIYTFSRETSDKDIINIIIQDFRLSLCELIKKFKDSKINNVPMSMKNTFEYIWNMNNDNMKSWECIYENKTNEEFISLLTMSELGISKEMINNILPKNRLVTFYIFKNDILDNSHKFATYNILFYGNT